MHPQLQTDNKRILCREFIEALETCHADGWAKWTGRCNQIKIDLNMCLRRERVERTTKNREAAKQRRQKTEEVWKDLREEE